MAADRQDCLRELPGYTRTDACNFFCRDALWTDVAIFYLGNYFAHAATIYSRPGQSILNTGITVVTALMLPGIGVVKGADAISSLAVFAQTPLQMAARAGALCVVVKEDVGEEGLPADLEASITDRKVIGKTPGIEEETRQVSVGEFGSNFVKAAISAAQLVYALSTLYRTSAIRDYGQLYRYGYAAFGLSVVPYAWMSLINLAGNLLCPRYSSMYIVRSKALDELEGDKTSQSEKKSIYPVSGVVGRIDKDTEKKIQDEYVKRKERSKRWIKRLSNVGEKLPSRKWKRLFESAPTIAVLEAFLAYFSESLVHLPLPFVIATAPIAIVGGLTGFSPGHESELYQRVLMLMWMLFGAAVGPVLAHGGEYAIEPRPILGGITRRGRIGRKSPLYGLLATAITAFYTAPAVGGFVVVGLMLRQYGVCSLVPDQVSV
ncbi:hypothetical protein DL771_006012 [Monosporascus sp. 5C6A]|nr:hypothetical protein DL771_006012 [Monosporascus sp. 5C6A]